MPTEKELPDEAHLLMRRKILASILEDIHVLYPCKSHVLFLCNDSFRSMMIMPIDGRHKGDIITQVHLHTCSKAVSASHTVSTLLHLCVCEVALVSHQCTYA